MKKFTIAAILTFQSVFLAGQWNMTGIEGFAPGPISTPAIVVNPITNEPTVFFRDDWTKASVMRFNGTSWVYIGKPGFSDGDIDCESMAFDANGTPYIAFADFVNNQVMVMKFDGTEWIYVGKKGVSGNAGSFESLVIDSKGFPIVAFRDVSSGYKASVMKYDGNNWNYIGTPGFSTPAPYPYGAAFISLAIDRNDVLYVAYSDDANYGRATVQKFNGSTWDFIGTSFAGWNSQYSKCLAIDSKNRPVLACQLNGKVTVMRYDNNVWSSVGSSSFSQSGSEFTCIALDKSDNIYVAYQDYEVTRRASVMWYNGVSWQYLGKQGFSPASTQFTTIDVDTKGTVYVGFTDGNTNPKWNLSVMKYENTIIDVPKETAIAFNTFGVFPNPTGSMFTVNYRGDSSNLVINITNQLGQLVLSKKYSNQSYLQDSFDLSSQPKGIYFIELISDKNREVKKFVIQ